MPAAAGPSTRKRGGRRLSAPPAPAAPLPVFIAPMLCTTGAAFDSDDHLFEVKWDGTRALVFRDADGVRILNRRKVPIGPRYPELVAAAVRLPPGTVLDGEVVVLAPDGRPDFSGLQSREQVAGARRAAEQARLRPATLAAFDQLYDGHESIMARRCDERREVLRRTVAALPAGAGGVRIVMSEGVTGAGVAYFEHACERGLEGIVAKRLDAPYQPGKRTGAWVKVKRCEVVYCAVVGYVPEGRDDFGALVIAAAEEGGALRCAGKVGSGFDGRRRARVNAFLAAHPADAPPVPCPGIRGARWVAPGLYCAVRCMEWTRAGGLRAPVATDVFERPPATAAAQARTAPTGGRR
ncbi:MAG TPA: hypothetical protein VEA69_08045 [Tepidisphaeraceae bacterium]|nr:hypothetical protein [Tepidisphaeraceae bacterium]